MSNYKYIAFVWQYSSTLRINFTLIPISLFKLGGSFYISAQYSTVYMTQAGFEYISDTKIKMTAYDNATNKPWEVYLVK